MIAVVYNEEIKIASDMFTLLVFLVVLAVLVLSHEWGHFLLARSQGIAVREFGFGFPPRLVGIRRLAGAGRRFQVVWGRGARTEEKAGSVLYSINLIPLGGFVRIKGEDADSGEALDSDSFNAKKSWQKAMVLLAGVAMNVVLAAIFLSLGFMVGFPSVVEPGAPVAGETTLRVIQVLPGKPAEAAGVAAGDAILAVGGLNYPRLVDLQKYVDAHRDEEIAVAVERNGRRFVKKIRPIVYADTGRGGIGVALVETGLVKYPWPQAVYRGVATTGVYLEEIIFAFWHLIKGIVAGAGVTGAVSGPVGVAVMTGEAARLGVAYLLQFSALLSLNLAVLNILPIPALDGGRLLFVVFNSLRRHPIAPRVEHLIHAVSFVFLMLLVAAITVKDLNAFSSFFSSVWSRIF